MSIQSNNVGLKNNAEWNSFANFALVHDDKTIVKVSGFNDYESKNEALQLAVSEGDSVKKLWRSKTLQNTNIAVRTEFKKAVFARLGLEADDPNAEIKLPPGVKKAMKNADFNNMGKPLTVRQIKAVDAAIRKYQPEFRHLNKYNERIDSILSDGEAYGAELEGARKSKNISCSLNGKPVNLDEFAPGNIWRISGRNAAEKRKLRSALLSFCNESNLPYSQKNPLRIGGRKPLWPENGLKNSVAITKSLGGGYDIVVKQKFSNITKMADPTGKKGNLFFRADKPLSYDVTFSYHLEMKNGKPVVSIKKSPSVELRRGQVVEASEVGKGLVQSLMTKDREKCLSKVDKKVRAWLDGLPEMARNVQIKTAYEKCVKAAVEDVDRWEVTASDIAEQLKSVYEYITWLRSNNKVSNKVSNEVANKV